MLECPLYHPLEISFYNYLKNLVLGSLKSFFQLDQQVNISLSISKKLPHSATIEK